MRFANFLARREDGLPDWAWVFLSILLVNVHQNRPGLKALRLVLVRTFGRDYYSCVDISLGRNWRVAIGFSVRRNYDHADA